MLWREWAIAFGAPIVIIILSWLISRTWIPLIAFVMAWVMRTYALGGHYYSHRRCMRMVHLSSTVLFISALIMVVCLVITRTNYFGPETNIYYGFNKEIPYIVALIVFPVMALTMIKALLFDKHTRYCRGCEMHSNFTRDSHHLSMVCETRYQERLMMWLSLGISVMNWTYYLLFYININLNTPDRFYFIFAPTLVYALSLVFLAQRYFLMSGSYSIASVAEHGPKSAEIRFIVLRGDDMLLNLNEEEAEYPYDTINKADTPAVVKLKDACKPALKEVTELFAKNSGLDAADFTLKRLYTDADPSTGEMVIHYAAILNPDRPLPDTWTLGTDWVRLDELDRRLRMGITSPMLASEIRRIVTITMAWKSYDREGRRKYPIKNYRPTFRLRDFKDWTVDYADPIWLHVAVDNEDKAFWKFRRVMRRLTSRSVHQ